MDLQKPNRSEYEGVDPEDGNRKTDNSGDPEEVPTNSPSDDKELEELLKSNEKRTLVYLGAIFWITVIIVLGAVVGTLLGGNGAGGGGRVMLRAEKFLQNNAVTNRWLGGFEPGVDKEEIMVTNDNGARIWTIKNPDVENNDDDDDCVRYGQPVVIEHEEVSQSLFLYPLNISPVGCHMQTTTERERTEHSGDRWIIQSSYENTEERSGECVLYNEPLYIRHEQFQDLYLASGADNHAAQVVSLEEDQYLFDHDECVKFKYEWIIREDQEIRSTINDNDEAECAPIPYCHVFESKEELQEGIKSYCNDEAIAADSYGDAFCWDVCAVTDMSSLFRDGGEELCIPEDISEWDVSSVTDFSGMFSDTSTFDQDISVWNVGSGTNFTNMFSNASAFNQDVSNWDVSSGTTFTNMFSNATAFSQDIGGWNVSSGMNFDSMFKGASNFNQSLVDWTDILTSRHRGCGLTETESCPSCHDASLFWCRCHSFQNKAEMQEAIELYCDSKDEAASIYGDPSCWDVSAVTDMSRLFWTMRERYMIEYCVPEGITKWDVSHVVDFSDMFSFMPSRTFNLDISGWNVSSGQNFKSMFAGAADFDQDIGNWDVSSGVNFNFMFERARAFNQDISNWDVSSGVNFWAMFGSASAFNQDISEWDISEGRNFDDIFWGARSFDQNLTEWTEKLRVKNEGCVGENCPSCEQEQQIRFECAFPGPTPAPTPAPTPTMAPTVGPQAYFYMIESEDGLCLFVRNNWEQGSLELCEETDVYQQWYVEYSEDGEKFTTAQIRSGRLYYLYHEQNRANPRMTDSSNSENVWWSFTEEGYIRNEETGYYIYITPITGTLMASRNPMSTSISVSFVQKWNQA